MQSGLPEHIAEPILSGFVGCGVNFALSSDQVKTMVYEGREGVSQEFLLKAQEHINSIKKKTLNDAVTPQRQSQFTLKMKANAIPRLLSSLV